jgi:hypothetical protein
VALVALGMIALISWLWTRVIWMVQWYIMVFVEYCIPQKQHDSFPYIHINWWDTLPVLVAIAIALINGLSESYLKTSPTPLLLQLSLIAWGFGSTTAVQAFFAILEKSPLGRYL